LFHGNERGERGRDPRLQDPDLASDRRVPESGQGTIMSRRAVGVFLVLLMGGALVQPSPPDDGPTFGVAARTVRVPVSVLDGAGAPVLGLKGSSFQVSENGRRQDVILFSAERRPLRLALALDVSASMHDKMRQLEESLRHFVDLLEPADEILVMTFNDRVRVVQEPTSDRLVLSNVLDRLDAAGGTALYDAAFEAIRRVGAGPAESKAVVLVTDGVDTASDTAFGDLREHARRMEVPVFSIGLDSWDPLEDPIPSPRRPWPGDPPPRDPGTDPRGWPPRPPPGTEPRGWPPPPGGPGVEPRGWPPRPPGTGTPGWPRPPRLRLVSSKASTPRSGFDAAPLLALAEDTGGRLLAVSRSRPYAFGGEPQAGDALKRAVESIALMLRHRYLLGYEPPAGRHGWRDIDVRVDKPGVAAHARRGYYAGS
jgi:hypothetical protein